MAAPDRSASVLATTRDGEFEPLGESGASVLSGADAFLAELDARGASSASLRLARPRRRADLGAVVWQADAAGPVTAYGALDDEGRERAGNAIRRGLGWYDRLGAELASSPRHAELLLGNKLERALFVPSEDAVHLAADGTVWIAPWGAVVPGETGRPRVLDGLARQAVAPPEEGEGVRSRFPWLTLLAGVSTALVVLLVGGLLAPSCSIRNPFTGAVLVDRCDDAAAMAAALARDGQVAGDLADARAALAASRAACDDGPSPDPAPGPPTIPVTPDDPNPTVGSCESKYEPNGGYSDQPFLMKVKLGDDPGTVVVKYHMAKIKDALTVSLDGDVLADTGPVDNTGTVEFDYPGTQAGGSGILDLIIRSNANTATSWCVAVLCPGDSPEGDDRCYES